MKFAALLTILVLIGSACGQGHAEWQRSSADTFNISDKWVWVADVSSQPSFHGGLISFTLTGSCHGYTGNNKVDIGNDNGALYWTCGDSEELSESVHLFISDQTVTNTYTTTDAACQNDSCILGPKMNTLLWVPAPNDGQQAGSVSPDNVWTYKHYQNGGHCGTLYYHWNTATNAVEVGAYEVVDSHTVITVVLITNAQRNVGWSGDWDKLKQSIKLTLTK